MGLVLQTGLLMLAISGSTDETVDYLIAARDTSADPFDTLSFQLLLPPLGVPIMLIASGRFTCGGSYEELCL